MVTLFFLRLPGTRPSREGPTWSIWTGLVSSVSKSDLRPLHSYWTRLQGLFSTLFRLSVVVVHYPDQFFFVTSNLSLDFTLWLGSITDRPRHLVRPWNLKGCKGHRISWTWFFPSILLLWVSSPMVPFHPQTFWLFSSVRPGGYLLSNQGPHPWVPWVSRRQ